MSRLRLSPPLLLAVIAAVAGLVALLSASPPGVTLRADTRPAAPVRLAEGETCVPLSILPAETDAVRVQLAEGAKAPEQIEIRGPNLTVLSGAPRETPRGTEYRLDRAIGDDLVGSGVCVDLNKPTALLGEGERPSLTLLGAHRSTWLSAVPLLSERASFGRGTVLGVAALPLALLALVAAWVLAIRLAGAAFRDRHVLPPRAARRVGAIAALFGAAFAMTTPPLQAPDEMMHLHYVQVLAEHQAVPKTIDELPASGFSPQLQQLMGGARVSEVAFSPDRRPPWTTVEDGLLDDAFAQLPSGGAVDSFTNASSQPPGYYATLAVAQAVTGGSILDRLLVMRLLSALLFAVGVAGAIAFAREAVPSAGGLVVAGGVILASLPVSGFIGGSINPDAALLATSSWTLALLAMILRRGATVRRGLLLGVVLGLGVLSKLTFTPLLIAAFAAALVVIVRGVRGRDLKGALGPVAAAGAALLVVAGPYIGWAIFSGRGIAFGPVDPNAVAPIVTLRETLAYTFELFIGQVGPIADRIGNSGPVDIWGVGLTGRLGWLDYGFPRWTAQAFMVLWGMLGLGAALGVVRAGLRRRSIPLDAVVYGVAVVALMLLIARSGLSARLMGHSGFEQARYLLPVAAIGVAGVGLALLQLPRPQLRRWAASMLVVLALVHGTAGFFLTVGRYFA